jgi:hypothetical protein
MFFALWVTEMFLNSKDALLQILLQLVFPKTNCSNLLQPKQFGDLPVAFAIATDLGCPKGLVGLRDMPAFLAPVPKAPVYKNRQLGGAEIEIGLPGQCGVKCPSSDPGPYQAHSHSQLSRSVALAAYCCHRLRALCRNGKLPGGEFSFKPSFHCV